MQSRALYNTWATYLSRKDVSLICFILAVLLKLCFSWFFFQVGNDKFFQAMAGKNLAEGHGITIQQVHAPDLSAAVYEPLEGWPPAYSVMVACFYWLVRDLQTACYIIEVLTILFYFVVLLQLLRLLQFPGWLSNLLLIFTSLSFPEYTMRSTPTDLIGLALAIYACNLTIVLFNKEKRYGGWWLGFINAFPAWLRYMSIPTSFIIPAFFLWNGWAKKDKRLLRIGWQTGVFAVVGVVSVLVFQKLYVGEATYVQPTERGLFWENLADMHPVFFGALFNLDFLFVQLQNTTGIKYGIWINTVTWINNVLFLALTAWFLYYGFKQKWKAVSHWQVFLLSSGLVSLVTVLLLAYLSVTISAYYAPPKNYIWTYINDRRYYIFLDLLFLLVLSKWIFDHGHVATRVAFLVVMAAGISHGLYYLTKHFTFDRRHNRGFVTQYKMIHYTDSTVRHFKGDVIVSGEPTLAHTAVLAGGKGLYNMAELLSPGLTVKRPTLILLHIREREFPFYEPWLKKNGLRPAVRFGTCDVYHYYLSHQ